MTFDQTISRQALNNDPTKQTGATPDGFNLFRQPWLVVACLLLAAAAVLLILSHTDAAFVAAALGVSAWFWNVRGNLKRKHGLEKQGRRDWRPRGDD